LNNIVRDIYIHGDCLKISPWPVKTKTNLWRPLSSTANQNA